MRSSERISGKTIDTSAMRPKIKSVAVPYSYRAIPPDYCRECRFRKRGNTFDLDFCKKRKKLCKDARKTSNIASMKCDGYKKIIDKSNNSN